MKIGWINASNHDFCLEREERNRTLIERLGGRHFYRNVIFDYGMEIYKSRICCRCVICGLDSSKFRSYYARRFIFV